MADHCVFVFVKTYDRSAEAVGNEIKDSIPEIREIYSIMGEHDLLIKIVSADIAFIQTVVNEKVRPVKGVSSTSTILGYQIYGDNWLT
jgi:DNA-binding Lrp family transcriptional regulator